MCIWHTSRMPVMPRGRILDRMSLASGDRLLETLSFMDALLEWRDGTIASLLSMCVPILVGGGLDGSFSWRAEGQFEVLLEHAG